MPPAKSTDCEPVHEKEKVHAEKDKRALILIAVLRKDPAVSAETNSEYHPWSRGSSRVSATYSGIRLTLPESFFSLHCCSFFAVGYFGQGHYSIAVECSCKVESGSLRQYLEPV
eukprot:1161225-Pelagomonas_calceolata.AAC.14